MSHAAPARTAAAAAGKLISQALEQNPQSARELSDILYQPPGEDTSSLAALMLLQSPTPAQPQPAGPGRPRNPRLRWNPVDCLAGRIREILPDEPEIREAMSIIGEAAAQPRGQEDAGQAVQHFTRNKSPHGAFYTKPEAAGLMAALAIRRGDRQPTPERMKRLRIADYGCGAGALLAPAYRRIRRLLQEAGHDPDQIHKHMVKHCITGADISPAAVAAAAARLIGEGGPKGIKATGFVRFHYGYAGKNAERFGGLGALDGMSKETLEAQRTLPGAGTPLSAPEAEPVSLACRFEPESQDYILMNPPYGTPVSHREIDQNPGGTDHAPTTDEEIARLAARFKQMARQSGTGQHGLGHLFARMATRNVKRKGVIALILPVSAVDGSAGAFSGPWLDFRNEIAARFTQVKVITLSGYEPEKASFSCGTAAAEAMIVAVKARLTDPPAGEATFVNLLRLPDDEAEADEFAGAIAEAAGPLDEPAVLNSGSGEIGFAVRRKIEKDTPWPMPRLKSPEMLQAAADLGRGIISIGAAAKRRETREAFPATILGKLAMPTRCGISGMAAPEDPDPRLPALPLLNGHDSKTQKAIAISANAKAVPAGRAPRKAAALHLNGAMRPASQATSMCYADPPAVSGTGWQQLETHNPEHRKAVAVWANTTPGLIARWSASSHANDGLAAISKSQVPLIPFLDLDRLTGSRIESLNEIFDRRRDAPMLAASEAWRDPARIELDRLVLEETLGLGPASMKALRAIRAAWCEEPTVQGKKGSRAAHRELMRELRQEAETALAEALECEPEEAPVTPAAGPPGPRLMLRQRSRRKAKTCPWRRDRQPGRTVIVARQRRSRQSAA